MCRRIIGSYQSDASIFPAGFGPRGLPIGNLTSQWFANIVGSRIDHHVKHVLGCRHYARYMDDLILLGRDKETVQGWNSALAKLIAEMGLVINPKTRTFATRTGVPFLGHMVWADHRRILRPNVVGGRRRMRRVMERAGAGEVSVQKAEERLRSWFAHLSHADTHGLRRQLADEASAILRESYADRLPH